MAGADEANGQTAETSAAAASATRRSKSRAAATGPKTDAGLTKPLLIPSSPDADANDLQETDEANEASSDFEPNQKATRGKGVKRTRSSSKKAHNVNASTTQEDLQSTDAPTTKDSKDSKESKETSSEGHASVTQESSNLSGVAKAPKPFFETYYGFVDDPMDALYIVEGCVHGVLKTFSGSSIDMAKVSVRSGSIICVPDKSAHLKRWRDNLRWSPSRAYGHFLLYRQIEFLDDAEASVASSAKPVKHGNMKKQGTNPTVAGLEPMYSNRTLKEGTQLAEGGITKRTITLQGSDGCKYRIISYYCAADVMGMTRNTDVATGDQEIFRRPIDDPALSSLAKNSIVNYGQLLADTIGYNDPGMKYDRMKEETPNGASHESSDRFPKRLRVYNRAMSPAWREPSKKQEAQRMLREAKSIAIQNHLSQITPGGPPHMDEYHHFHGGPPPHPHHYEQQSPYMGHPYSMPPPHPDGHHMHYPPYGPQYPPHPSMYRPPAYSSPYPPYYPPPHMAYRGPPPPPTHPHQQQQHPHDEERVHPDQPDRPPRNGPPPPPHHYPYNPHPPHHHQQPMHPYGGYYPPPQGAYPPPPPHHYQHAPHYQYPPLAYPEHKRPDSPNEENGAAVSPTTPSEVDSEEGEKAPSQHDEEPEVRILVQTQESRK